MTSLFRPSLRTRALLALGAAFSIIVMLIGWVLSADLTYRIQSESDKLSSMVSVIAARQERIISQADAVLNGLSLRDEIQNDAPAGACVRFLSARVDREPMFRSATVLNSNGSVRCASENDTGSAPVLRDMSLSRILGAKNTTIAEAVTAEGRPAVLLGKSIRNHENQPNGIGVLAVDLTWLQADTARLTLPAMATVSLVDGSSRVIARFPDPEGYTGQRLAESRIIEAVLSSKAAGTLQETNLIGDRRIVAHAPILTAAEGGNYHILLSISRKSVVAPLQRRAAESLAILLIVLIGVMSILTIGMNRLLLRPLARLSDASLRLERGDLTARSGLAHGGDEIGLLAQRFDLSAAAIESREVELLEKAAVLDNANDAIILRDLDHRITFWNTAATQLYGWTGPEAIGQSVNDLLNPDANLFQAATSSLYEAGKWSGEFEKRTKDGRTLVVQVSWTLLMDRAGAPLSILAIDSDITEQRLADQKLRESDERFRSLAESISEIFWIIDAERTKCLYVSPSFETIMGRKCQELYETPSIWADAIHPEDRDRVLAAAETGQVAGTYDETYRILHADGTIRWLHERAFPVRDEEGRVQRIAGTAADVTQHRLVEEQLRQSQKMDAIGRLAGGIAHDFNNLLTVITGYTDLMLDRPDLDATASTALHRISDAANRASALTAQLLGFSRKTILKPQVIDLNAAVREMGDMLARLIGEDILFNTVLSKSLDPVIFDPGLLGQVLMNLAVNARDAMPDGGQLTIETVQLDLEEDLVPPGRQPGQYVMLAVTDTGIGMPPNIRERMFEPFFTTKEVGKGTGLGLSMVFGIVQQSGGFIGVYSEPGHGTTFKIFLPTVQSELTLGSRPQPMDSVAGTETILVVEDEPAVRDLIKIRLEQLGYKVLIAVDGQDALRLLEAKSGDIDVVLTDVIMPNLGGPGFVAQMKERTPDVKVLFMSGYTDDVVVRHGLLNANVSFIQKPFTRDALAEKLRGLFSGARH